MQRRMMRKAGQVYGLRWSSGLLAVLLLALVVQQMLHRARVLNLRERTEIAVEALQKSRGILVPFAIADLESFPIEMVRHELQKRIADSDERQKLALAYALAHFGSPDVDYFVGQIPFVSADGNREFGYGPWPLEGRRPREVANSRHSLRRESRLGCKTTVGNREHAPRAHCARRRHVSTSRRSLATHVFH